MGYEHDHERRQTITIEIPSLTKAVEDIVFFLNSRDNQQKQIDALNAEVKALTEKLQTSSAGLQGAVDNKPVS